LSTFSLLRTHSGVTDDVSEERARMHETDIYDASLYWKSPKREEGLMWNLVPVTQRLKWAG